MGTEVQYKMYLPLYYPVGDLNDNNANGSRTSHNESRTFDQYCALFSTTPAIHGHMSHVKEQMKEGILKHETIFKHQLYELHRLYKIQMDIMNEVQSKDQPVETSHSGSLSFARKDEKKRRHSDFSSVDFNCHQSMPSVDNLQSPIISMDVKIRQSHKESSVQDHESFESRTKKLQRRLFGIELPADKYINDEMYGQGKSGGPGMESYPPKRISEVAWDIHDSLSTFGGVDSCCNGDAFSSNASLEKKKWPTDLNEPVQIEEACATASASIDILGNFTCSKEQIHGQGPSANSFSGFQCVAREIPQTPCGEEGEGVGLSSPCLKNKNRKNELLPYACNSGQTMCNKSSLNGDLLCECLPSSCESAEVGCRKAQEVDQNNADEHTKRTIFGVEISARNHVESAAASDKSFLQPLSWQSYAAYPESSSFSSWMKQAKTLRQSLISLHGNPGFSNSNKSSAIFMNGPDLIRDISLTNCNARSVPSVEAEFSYQNVLSFASQLESKESKVDLSSSVCGCTSCIGNSISVSEKVPLHSPTNRFMMNAKSTKELNMNAAPPRQYQYQATFDSSHTSVDCPRKEINSHGGLSWHNGTSFCDGKSPHQMGLDCLQNYCQQFVNKGAVLKDSSGNVLQDSLSMTNAHDAADKRIEVGDCSSKCKILGVPILVKPILKDIPSTCFPSKPNLCDSKTNIATSWKSGILDTDLNYDTMLSESGMDSGTPQNTDNRITGLRAVDCNDNARNQIDLNVSVTEEEAELAESLPVAKLKIAVEIDLEVPVVETETDCTSGGKLPESKLGAPLDSLKDESGDFEEGLIKDAAETLVAISSSSVHDFVDNATNIQFRCSLNDSLQWFAEIITSHKFEMENDMGSVTVVDKDGTGQDNSIPKGMDYFEYVTLNLRETKVAECHYEPQALENTKHETALLKRPRRGQARRGRQHKDFQRDVLPGLASLSKNHVTEDFQTIEGLIRATGGAWQSALLQRNSLKKKGGRGRKRSSSSATPPRVTAISPTQPQQVKCGELGLEEVSKLAGWGKRTRRPPRQRCPINHHIVAVQ